jgi:hypothetical protein
LLPTAMLSGCAATGYNSSFTTTSVVFSYPVTAPAISIARPVNGAAARRARRSTPPRSARIPSRLRAPPGTG